MISDYSEVMSKINSKISELNQALQDRQYLKARTISNTIIDDMEDLWQWSINQDSKDNVKLRGAL